MNLEEIKARINPQYSDTIGTESHERKWLCDEIESLRQQLASRDTEVAEIRRGNSAAVSAYTTCSDERDQLREQVAMLRDRLSNVLTTRNIEARASMALANAEENFTDSNPEHDAYTAAMIKSSNAEKLAREALAATEPK